MKKILSNIAKIFLAIKAFISTSIFIYNKFKVEIEELVKVVEKAAKDGVIDTKERKEIASEAVEVIAKKCGKKLSWVHKIIVNKIIDKIAQKLPKKDIVIPNIVMEIVKKKQPVKRVVKKYKKTNFAKKKKVR